MKEVTREQVTDKEIQMLIDSHENGTAMFLRVDAYYLMAKELQERRKAAMDSEPVGYFGRFDPDDEDLIDQCSKNVKGAFPLYRHAQPAPVVPEEMTPEMMRAVQLNSELGEYAASNLSGAYDLFAEFWKVACRAAMLNQK